MRLLDCCNRERGRGREREGEGGREGKREGGRGREGGREGEGGREERGREREGWREGERERGVGGWEETSKPSPLDNLKCCPPCLLGLEFYLQALSYSPCQVYPLVP